MKPAISEKSLILDVKLCSEYSSEFSSKRLLRWPGTNIPNTHEKSTKTSNRYWIMAHNGKDGLNVEQRIKMQSACVATKTKP